MARKAEPAPPRQRRIFDWEGAKARLARAEASIQAAIDPPPEEIRRIMAARTAALAAPLADATPKVELDLVEFRLDDRRYAFNAADVERSIEIDAVTRLPGAPTSHLGLIVHRGGIFPLVDIRVLIGGRRGQDWRPRHALLVVEDRIAVAVAVDEVVRWTRIDSNRVAQTAEGSGKHVAILGLIGDSTELIDARLLVQDARLVINAKPA